MTATCSHERPHSLPGRALHAVIRAYQWVFAGRVSPCRYEPSCSSYALESLQLNVFVKVYVYSIRRQGRCPTWRGHRMEPAKQDNSATNP